MNQLLSPKDLADYFRCSSKSKALACLILVLYENVRHENEKVLPRQTMKVAGRQKGLLLQNCVELFLPANAPLTSAVHGV